MAKMFITFEGIEGCGKTTQIRLLAEALRAAHQEMVLTREPGGTIIGEQIRKVLMDASHREMTPLAELLLYEAARHQHVVEVIEPALAADRIVLCDRFFDSTTAYQGAARYLDADLIVQLNRIATDGRRPDLTILLDCPVEEGLARARHRNERDATDGAEDRFEREELDFHRRVREGFLAIAQAEPERVAVVPLAESIDTTHKRILQIVEEKLNSCRNS